MMGTTMPENIDGGHHTDITYRDKEIPLATCSKCGEVPWDEVRCTESGKFIRTSGVMPTEDEEHKLFLYYEVISEDEDVQDGVFWHAKTIHDPDPQEVECEGILTIPKGL
jgi:hypothetical protein